ncbi:MAG: 50S ribosomal protein L10 [bacterium]|nr:MAG: 50S ribosomal protein L10 [bacterium]
MARPEKEKIVAEIADKISSAAGIYLADYQGLSVEEINDLRNKFREASIEFKVVKNTLARLSVAQVGLRELDEYLTGPTAMAFCLADPIVGAKILSDFQKQNEKLELKACVFDDQVYDKAHIEKISKLPSPEQIRAQTLGIISAPLRNMVGVLNSLLTSMVTVLNEIKKQRES